MEANLYRQIFSAPLGEDYNDWLDRLRAEIVRDERELLPARLTCEGRNLQREARSRSYAIRAARIA